jgi:hypothetical protein
MEATIHAAALNNGDIRLLSGAALCVIRRLLMDRFSRSLLFIAALSVVIPGCSSSGGSQDAGMDGGTLADAAPDASGDAETDVGIDGGMDSGFEDTGAGGDASTDASVDGGPAAFHPDPQKAYDDIAVLASAAYEGRAPGTPGGIKTVDYVRKRFEDLGLVRPYSGPSYFQPFSFDQWGQTAPAKVELGGETLVEGTDYLVFNNSMGGSVTAELVFAGYGMTVPAFKQSAYPKCPLDPAGYDDYEGLDVKDKIVLLLRRTPNDSTDIMSGCPANKEGYTDPTDTLARFDYKAKNAKFHGAKAMILVQNFSNGPIPPNPVGFPTMFDMLATGVFADRDKVISKVADLQTWASAIDSTLKPGSHATGVTATVEIQADMIPVNTKNIIGVLEGTDPVLKDEIIVIGAHMDHLGKDASGQIFPGADDNASGTSVMMELARTAVASGLKPARTIVFAAWNAEELGLIGSCYYVDSDPLYPIDKVKAALSLDMVGVGNGTGLFMFGSTDLDKAWLAGLMAGAAAKKGLEYVVESAEPSYASDHACFAQAGVPAVMTLSLAWEDHQYYHTPQDTSDTISLDTLKASAELLWAMLVPLSEGKENDYSAAPKGILRIADREKVREIVRRLDKRM